MRPLASVMLAATLLLPTSSWALSAAELGVLYRRGDVRSELVARAYQVARQVPDENVVGIDVPTVAELPPERLTVLRESVIARLPGRVRALLLVWSTPFRAGCMSITSAFAIGYRPDMCEPGCGRTALSPLFDSESLDSARRFGWRIAMLLPADDSTLAGDVIDRGRRADGTAPPGTVYLVSTDDPARNVRASGYAAVVQTYGQRADVREVSGPPAATDPPAIAYFTGVARVRELGVVRFRPGAVADHLTSAGGVLEAANGQTTVVDWLRAGATGSYGTVTEPCNHTGKFPSPLVFLSHYLRGETLIESYWKSVAMPGQGLFVGEPLAAPYSRQAAGRASGSGSPTRPAR